jgi:hypothetical protein
MPVDIKILWIVVRKIEIRHPAGILCRPDDSFTLHTRGKENGNEKADLGTYGRLEARLCS